MGNNLDNDQQTNKLEGPLQEEAQVLHTVKKSISTNKSIQNYKYSTLEILVLLFHKLKKANLRQLFSPKSGFLLEYRVPLKTTQQTHQRATHHI